MGHWHWARWYLPTPRWGFGSKWNRNFIELRLNVGSPVTKMEFSVSVGTRMPNWKTISNRPYSELHTGVRCAVKWILSHPKCHRSQTASFNVCRQSIPLIEVVRNSLLSIRAVIIIFMFRVECRAYLFTTLPQMCRLLRGWSGIGELFPPPQHRT